MKIALKQRLVGTIVIGCLVIIFVPILLDGEGVTPQVMTTSIPDAPPMPAIPVIEPVIPEIVPDTLEQAEVAIAEVADTDTSAPPAPAQPQLSAAGLPATWAVRLGSFGELANAEGLVSRLKQQGYKAFSRPMQTSRGSLTGVYVGPVMTEREAGGLQQELGRTFQLEGAVVQFGIDELEN